MTWNTIAAHEEMCANNAAHFATLDYLHKAIEHAPADPGQMAATIKGWEVENGVYLCARCAGRIMARGCRVPDCLPVWSDNPAVSLCCLCGK